VVRCFLGPKNHDASYALLGDGTETSHSVCSRSSQQLFVGVSDYEFKYSCELFSGAAAIVIVQTTPLRRSSAKVSDDGIAIAGLSQ